MVKIRMGRRFGRMGNCLCRVRKGVSRWWWMIGRSRMVFFGVNLVKVVV